MITKLLSGSYRARHHPPFLSNLANKKRFQTTTTTIPKENLPETVTIIPTVSELTKVEDYLSDIDVSLVGHLQGRYLVESITNDDLFKWTEPSSEKRFKLYCGADPTAESLHLGNLLPLMVLLHFNLRGHDVVGLVGGATGAVGDPSGRTTERTQLAEEKRVNNVKKIQDQLSKFLKQGVEYAKSRKFPIEKQGQIFTENNASWWKSIKILDFLFTYGKHIRVSAMLGRDSIQSRLKSEHGLGFNEFSYQVLQAYDFWHLFKNQKVNLQIGGNDQWGNITAGVDLISRLQKSFNRTAKSNEKVEEEPSFGMTVPLLTTPTGEKFGKSAGNAVFISENLTTPYQLYQYFINTPDELVAKLLKVFTILPMATIEKIIQQHNEDPGVRVAQRILAREVTDLIHGNGTGDEMAYVTSFLFPTPDQPFIDDISADKLIRVFDKSGILVRFKFDDFNIDDLKLSTLLAKVMKKSKTETKNLIAAGGIYLGLDRNQHIDPEDVVLFDKDHLIDGKLLLVRAGKQKYYVVEFS